MALLRSFLLLFVAGAALSTAQTLTDGAGTDVSYSVTFVNSAYDASTDLTTFDYDVTVGAMDGDLGFTVASTASCTVVSATPSSGFTAFGKIDAAAGLTGITWQHSAHSANVGKRYTVVLNGNVASGSSQVELKAGSGASITKEGVNGPNCDIVRPAPVCSIVVDDAPVCIDGTATATVRSEHSATSYAWSSDVGSMSGSDHSSVLSFPVDACAETAVITLTVTNTYGSQTTCSAPVSYNYVNKLGFKSYPADETVEAGAIPAPAVLEVSSSENCFAVTIEDSQTQNQQNLPYTITRTWKILDQCDSVTVVQQIDVQDNVPPTFVTTPPDRTVSCDEIPAPCEVAVADDSDVGLTVAFSESRIDVLGGCDSEFTLVRTWTTEDASRNKANYTQTLTVQDNINPRLIGVPDNIVVECDSVPQMAMVTAKDNCGMGNANVASTQTEFAGGLVRTWTVSDACGNSVDRVQTILVVDNTPPRITGVQSGSITVECDAVPASPCNVQAQDDCDNDIIPSYTYEKVESDKCANEYIEYHTWTATDAALNSATVSRTIHVVDTNGPEFEHHQASITLTCSSAVPSRTTAVDSCSGPRSVDMTEASIDATQENQYKLVRTYTSMDLCGTISTIDTTISVNDDEDPMLVAVPADTTVSCESVPDPANVLAYDNCACEGTLDLVVNYNEDVINVLNCQNRYTLVRTWDTQDCSGNTKSAVQTIVVEDNDSPVISATVDSVTAAASSSHTQECDAVILPTATAVDNCDDSAVVTFEDQRNNGSCDMTYDVVRTFTSVDSCGNSDPVDVTVNVQDTKVPYFTTSPLPTADVTYECDETANIAFEPTLEADDFCDTTLDVQFSGSIRENTDCEDKYELHREWSIQDECGHAGTSAFQTIHVQDTSAPTFTNCVDVDVTLEYYETIPDVPTIEVDDNCDATIAHSFASKEVGSRCFGSLTRTWTLSDRCGNAAATCTHTYTFRDTIGPQWSQSPSDLNVNCHSDFPLTTSTAFDPSTLPHYAELDYEVVGNWDDSTNVTVTHVCVQQPGSTCTDRRTYDCTFTARDHCGVASDKTFVVTVDDQAAHEFRPDTKADETIECGDTIPTPPSWTVFDSCVGSEETISFTTETVPLNDGKNVERRTYTYTATDTCGNTDSRSYALTVVDNTDPVITCPTADFGAQCPHDPDTTPTISDACNYGGAQGGSSELTLNPVPSKSGQSAPCTDYIQDIVWTVTDTVGNTNTCTVVYEIADTIPPTCDPISNVNEECPFTIVPPDMNCIDNCGGEVQVNDISSLSYSDSSAAPGYTNIVEMVEHKYEAIDVCGQRSEHARTVTVRDTKAPTFDNCPVAVTESCDAPATPVVTASDECQTVTVVHSDDQPLQSATCGDYTYTNTWVATDLEGHSTTCTQAVYVTTDRTLGWTVDQNWEDTIELGQSPPRNFSNVAAVNSCGDSIDVVCVATEETPNCAGDKVWTRSINTCTATQAEYGCDPASVSYVQTVVVIDTTPESISAGDDLQEDCASPSSPPAGCADADPACTTCGGTYEFVRTCSTTDACGNYAEDSATVSVTDSEAPLADMSNHGAVTVECGDAMPSTDPTATDNCDSGAIAPVAGADESLNITGAAANVNQIVVRKWTLTDLAGNAATVRQTVTIEDNVDPAMAGCSPYTDTDAENGGVDGSGNPAITTYSWPAENSCACAAATDPPTWHVDACDTDLTDACDSWTESAGSCQGEFLRIFEWAATDDNGNSASDYYTVSIKDTTAPVWYAPDLPSDKNVDISAIPEFPDAPTASDLATDMSGAAIAVTVTFEDIKIPSPEGDPDTFKLVRTWTAEDSCQNQAFHSMTMSVTDQLVEGNIIGLPPNATYECAHTFTEAEIFSPDDVVAVVAHWSDNNDLIVPESGSTPLTCVGDQTETWTWKFHRNDNVDYDATEETVITFEDTTPPVLSGSPGNANIDVDGTCGIPTAAVLTAEDACAGGHGADLVPDLTAGQAYFSSGARDVVFDETRANITGSADKSIYTVTRSWSSTDTCNNVASHTQVVTAFDNTPPTIFFADASASENNVHDDCANPTFSDVSCDDNCACTGITSTLSSWTLGCDWVYTKTWTASDAVGNTATLSQTFSYTDVTAPTFDNLEADHANDRCSALTLVNPTASDNCGTADVVLLSDTPWGPKHDFIRSFRITDYCGVTTDGVTTVTLSDTSPPVITSPDDTSVTCADPVPASSATFTDDCSALADVTMGNYTEVEEPACGGTKLVIRTWTADDHYNTVTAVQTITVQNDGAPDVATAPADETINVTGDVSCAVPTSAADLAASDCGAALPDVAADVQQLNDFTTVFTWTATDECGSSNIQAQTITRVDLDAPVITGVCADASHKCGTTPPTCDTVTCSDNCDASCTANFTETFYQDGDCQGTAYYIRTWTASDVSGNNAVPQTQTVKLYDLAAPVFQDGLVKTVSYECDSISQPANYTAEDECSAEATVERVTTSDRSGTEYPYNLYHTYTASDLCGNAAIYIQTVTIVDTTDPVMPTTPPVDRTDNCEDAVYTPLPVGADDNCGGTINSAISTVSTDGDSCSSNTIYRYTWTDGGGNFITHDQTVTRTDSTPPTLTVDGVVDQETITEECDRPATNPTFSSDDDCNVGAAAQLSEIAFDCASSSPGDVECVESYINKWSVTDGCGQTTEVFQTVIVKDTAGYVIESQPADAAVDICDYDSDASHAPVVSARDGCLEYQHSPVITNTSTGSPCDAEGMKVVYTYTWTDGYGHTTTGSHTITVTDSAAATVTAPATASEGASIECTAGMPGTTVTWSNGGYLKCLADGNNVGAVVPDVTNTLGSCDEEYTSTATYSYTDNCGRPTTETRSAQVVDTTKPVFDSYPVDAAFECDAIPPRATLTATDACASGLTVVPDTVRINGTCDHAYRLVHTWTVADTCGNTESHSQTVTVTDSGAPVLTPSAASPQCASTSVECSDALPDCVYDGADTCDDVTVDATQTTVGDKASCYTLIRTWSTSDHCGNPASETQTIVVTDNTPPTISGPSSVTVEFPTLPVPHPDNTDHTVDDNCANLAAPSLVCTDVPSGTPCSTVHTRTCTVTDECGNTNSHSYTVTVEDKTNPVLYGVPADFTVEKGEIPEIYTIMSHLSASDAHGMSTGDNIDISANTTSEVDTNNGKTVTWTFKAVDICGNFVEETTVVTEVDSCAPKFNDYPVDQTVECDSVPTACVLTTVNEDFTVEYKQVEETDGRLTRTWSVSDAAGNVESHTQIITVEDTVAPILSRSPSSLTISCCSQDMPSETVVALDNCDADISTNVTDTTETIGGPQDYRLIRTYAAEDAAGNSVTHVQTITVEDDAAPSLFPAPEVSVVIKCSEVTADLLDGTTAASTQAIDNCDENPSVDVTTTKVDSAVCTDNFVLYRTFVAADHNGNTNTVISTIEVSDDQAPQVNSVANACVKSGKTATFALSDLFSALDDCSETVVYTIDSCNSTNVADVTCSFDSPSASSVEVVSAPDTNDSVKVYVTACDDCNNCQQATATIDNLSTIEAATGGFACKGV